MSVDRISRPSARVILIGDHDEVLLIRVHDRVAGTGPVWLTPGGGVDPGEDLVTAAVRELAEETGLVLPPAQLTAPVAVSRGAWTFRGQPLYSENWYFAHRVGTFEPDPSAWTDLERELHTGWRWWSPDDLARTTEAVIPGSLADLVRRLGRDGWPSEPIELEWSEV
jgi:8-oxo-dGTP pyrophosphatase MutT (NUDIX family)